MAKTQKTFTDGTHRSCTPVETLARAEPHLAAMGITRVADVTGLDRIGVPVVNAFRPNSRSLSVSQGKGLTLEAAKASAVMEAIESFHSEEPELAVLSGSFAQIAAGRRVIALDGVPMLRGTRFDPDRPLEWYEGRDLILDESVWLPSELVHTDYTLPRRPQAGCFVASTNGLASGNHRIEAILHGICEVIERDAHTLWEHLPMADKAETRVDLDTVTDAPCGAVLAALDAAGMDVAVWDMTSDVGVATFHCLIADAQDPAGHSGGGAGTHPVREVALLRALTEAVQVRTNYITGARDDLHTDEYTDAGIATKTQYACALMSSQTVSKRSLAEVPTHEARTFEDDLARVLSRLTACGIREVIDVDLSKPTFGLAVHRVVIPGLEGPHDHDDYTPGPRARAGRSTR